jgi:putative inorganic carbon (HCO3(-)) transporter
MLPMPTASIARHLPLARDCIHTAAVLLVLTVIVLTPNALLLPEDLTGNPYNEKRIWAVLVLCSYGLLMILSRPARASWYATFAALHMAAKGGLGMMLVLGLLSAAVAARPDAALLEVTNLGLLFILAIGIATWAHETGPRSVWLFSCGFAAMALAYEARFLMGIVVMLVEQIIFSNHHLFLGFANLRFFNQVQTWTLPLLALPFFLAARFPVLRLIFFAGLSLWWLLLIVAASRGAFLAICGGAVITFAVFRQRSFPWIKLQLLAAGTALTVYFILNYFIFTSHSFSGEYALPERLADAFEDPTRLRLLHDAWSLFVHDPILGSGPMHYAYYFRDSYLHPHNSLLQLLSEWGLPVTLLLVALSLWTMCSWVREASSAAPKSDDHTTLMRTALLASISGATLHSLVSGIIVTPLSQLLAACIIGLMLSDYLMLRSGAIPTRPLQRWKDKVLVVSLAAAVLALGSLSTLTLFQSRDITLRTMEYDLQTSPAWQATPNPRFWGPGQLNSVEKDSPPSVAGR